MTTPAAAPKAVAPAFPEPRPYELYAVRYGTRQGRRPDFFLGGDPHDTPMSLDYYVWLARRDDHVCLIDTGFSFELAAKRGRKLLRNPIEALALLDVAPEQVDDVVLTHFHYDHAGNFDLLPAAQFHVQDAEMTYATGRYMRHKVFQSPYELDHVTGLVRNSYAGRVDYHDGDGVVSDGISVHRTGGHTMGMQCVRVFTRRGWVVLASDSSHFYEGYQTYRCSKIVFSVGDVIEGFTRLRQLATSEDHIIPGHDPKVMALYPAPSDALEGVVVRLDVPPAPETGAVADLAVASPG